MYGRRLCIPLSDLGYMEKRLSQLLGAIALATGLIFSHPAKAGFQPYDYILSVSIKALPNYLRYAGSSLTPVDKGTVTSTNVSGDGSVTPYEDLWFCNGATYGLERANPLPIESGVGLAIQVNFKTQPPGPAEIKSAAQSILRLYLDARVHGNPVMTVIVPDDQFADIVTAMGDEHFQPFTIPLEVPVQVSSRIFVQDESDKNTQSLCYAPQSFGN
jgi:hypothetical protein